jgi:NTE family protein
MSIFRSLVLYIFAFSLIDGSVSGQQATDPRPKIGLVLSGGGAKGLAHIGVLKVLEEAGIHPDFIAGSSMGGLVGGLYSIGYTADMQEKIVKSIDWNYYLTDEIPRRSITYEEKEDYDRFILSVPVAGKGIVFPGGVIRGQNIENLLNDLCAKAYRIQDFSKLPIPFLCNATDIETGREVLFDHGYLPEALRATMSIPSIFTPVEYDGKLLVDGGLVNNFPVNRIKEMGADIVIGVDVGFKAYKKEQLNNLFRIIEQSLFFYGETNNNANRKLCDIAIYPEVDNFHVGSFLAADTIIALGEAAARLQFPRLKALADSVNALYPKKEQSDPVKMNNGRFLLSQIIVNGLEHVSGELLSGKLQLNVMQYYSSKDISDAIDRLYSSLYFEKVSYKLEDFEQGVILTINVKEISEGYLKFGVHYDSNFKSALLLNTTFRNLLVNGSKWSVNTRLGEFPFLKAEVFKNNGWKPGYGLSFQSSLSEVFLYNNARKISNMNFYETKVQWYTMSIFHNSFALGTGIEYENSLIKPVIDPGETFTKSRYRLWNYCAFLQMDSYDDAFYPTRGAKFHSGIKLITAKDISPALFICARISNATKLSNRLTLINHLYAGTVSGDSIPPQYYFFSGGISESIRNGIMPFAGLDYMEVASSNLLSVKFDLQAKVYRDFYLVLMGNAGNFKNSFKDLISYDDILGGYGMLMGYNSIIGPIEFSLTRSANWPGLNAFFRIGYWF